MINNNTIITTNTNTVTTSQSTIYLKKSELPKSVSAFDNDKGYLTPSALETWLMKHSYIPKSDIEKIINNSKEQIIDFVDNSIGEDAVYKLEGYIEGNKKEIVAIKDKLTDLSGNISNVQTESKKYLTEQSLSGYATQSWVESKKYLTKHQDLSSYAKQSDINKINTRLETLDTIDGRLNNIDSDIIELKTNSAKYLTKHQDLSNYATQSWVKDQGFITENPDLSNYATQSWVESKNYLTEHQDLSNYATQSWVESKNYLTEHQDLSSYAKKTNLNSIDTKVKSLTTNQNTILEKLSDFATTDSLNDYVKTDALTQSLKDYAKNTTLNSQLAGYVKTSVFNSTLKNYAPKTSVYTKNNINTLLNGYLKIKDAKDTYVSRTEIEDTYVTKQSATDTYLTIEDYRGLKDSATINSQYKDKSLDEFKKDLEKGVGISMNGFYIVNKNDVVIVKDKEIINIFKDGVPTANLVWTEE